MTSSTLKLAAQRPFDLEVALFGHGWIDLAPNRWIAEARRFETVLAHGDRALDVSVTQRGSGLAVVLGGASAAGAAGARGARAVSASQAARAAITRMLRLDHDFAPFWTMCAATPGLKWVARRGAGRLMRGATLFEDLLKLLFTTNCSWAATRLMTQRLVDALGTRSASGRAAFPDAARCADEPEKFWRDVVRAGYRARAARELAEGFASGRYEAGAFEDSGLATDEVRRRLLDVRGIGPYAAGQALRLLGRHDDLALDSWCRGKLAKLLGRRRPPSDRAIERRYAQHGCERGLVLWMELTADWHGEGAQRERDRVLAAFRAQH